MRLTIDDDPPPPRRRWVIPREAVVGIAVSVQRISEALVAVAGVAPYATFDHLVDTMNAVDTIEEIVRAIMEENHGS